MLSRDVTQVCNRLLSPLKFACHLYPLRSVQPGVAEIQKEYLPGQRRLRRRVRHVMHSDVYNLPKLSPLGKKIGSLGTDLSDNGHVLFDPRPRSDREETRIGQDSLGHC